MYWAGGRTGRSEGREFFWCPHHRPVQHAKKMSTNVVVGTSLFQIIFVTANSTFFQSYLNQTVDIVLSALMILGGVIGAQIGVRIGSQLKAEYLRGILAILVLLVCAKILTDLILTPSDLFTTSIN